MALRNYALLFALVAGTISVPINVQDGDLNCARTCTESLTENTKFAYTEGRTYTFDYEGTTQTQLQGSTDQSSRLSIRATAEIQVISKCEMALNLIQVTLNENGQPSTETRTFARKLTANTLRFAFQDGRIEDLCSEVMEDDRVINIKRGILSAFQNSMESLEEQYSGKETDVSGVCPTEYKSEVGTFGGITITKSKDILACTERNGNITSIHAESYTTDSRIQNAPLLKSTHECTQQVSGKVLQSSLCTEVLMFRPFSKDSAGAITTATLSLRYRTYRDGSVMTKSAIQKRGSLLFQHVYDSSIDSAAKSEVLSLMSEICSEVTDEITKRTPELFGALVAKMKLLDNSAMMAVYRSVSTGRACNNNRGKQFFFDAIPMVATPAALELTKELINDGIVTGTEADMWLTQLAFIPRPTYDMLKSVQPLLSNQQVKTKALLGVSAMVHKICDVNTGCQRHSEVVDFVSTLTSNIGDCSSSDRDMILTSLKALGNAGNALTTTSVVDRCINNNNLDTEVKVAALQAFRRMPCTVSRDGAMQLYQDTSADSELRIHAFLAVMTCPSDSDITKIRMMLSGEAVNQVGSFVWTYLENVKETSSPLKQSLSSILQDAKLREDFRMDVRKYSRNIEKSFFSEFFNTGAQVESNIIWSQKSYIPRSAMVNVSLEMFGNSINLLEVGGRVQGLERIMEKFFGPDGYFTKMNTQELMDNKRQTAANYVSPFDALFKTADDDLRASMYVKMFGDELRYNELTAADLEQYQQLNVLELLMKLAEPKKIDITKNYQIIDSSIIVPTAIGMPMNLTVNGTISVSLDVSGQIDLRQIAASPRSFDINGNIKPSAAVVISGMMGVDAIVTKSSMKMVSTVHTSSQLKGKIQLQDGKVFNIELDTPQDKVEIFNVQTEFYMDGQKMQMPEAATVYKQCTGPMVTKLAGVVMCADVSLPEFTKAGLPLPPFTGPMSAQITIEKKDTHTGYSLSLRHESEPQTINHATWMKGSLHISLDTPGSTVDRKLLLEANVDPAALTANATLASPWKKFAWTGNMKNEETEKLAFSSLTIDETQVYSTELKLDTTVMNVKTVWKPSLKINMPNAPTKAITGTFETGTGKTIYGMDLKMVKFTRKPIKISGELTQTKGGQSYNGKVSYSMDGFSAEWNSNVNKATNGYSGQSTFSYQLNGRPEHRYTVSGKANQGVSADGFSEVSAHIGFTTTEFPQYQFSTTAKAEYSHDHVNTNLQFNTNDNDISLVFDQKTSYPTLNNRRKITHESSLKFGNAVDVAAKLTHESAIDTWMTGKTEATLQYATGKQIKASYDLDAARDNTKTVEMTLTYPGRDVSMKTEYNTVGDNTHTATTTVAWDNKPETRVTATGTYNVGATHTLTASVEIPNHPIAITATVRPELANFMGEAEVTYKATKWSAKTEYTLSSSRFTTSNTVTIPYEPRTLGLEMTLTSLNNQMSGETEATWADKKVGMTTTYNNNDVGSKFDRDVKVAFTSPIGEVEWSADGTVANRYGNMKSTLKYDGKTSEISGKLNLKSGMTGELSIASPYIQYGPVETVEASFTVNGGSFESELGWNPTNKLTASGSWGYSDVYTGKVDMTTPFTGYSRFGADYRIDFVNHQIQTNGFLNNQRATLLYNHEGYKSASFEVSYPAYSISGSASHNEDLENFESEASITINGSKYETKASYDLTTYSASLEASTPLDGYRTMSVSVRNSGAPSDFSSNIHLTWNSQDFTTKIQGSPMMSKVSVVTPTRNMLALYDIKGTPEKFDATTELKWANNKKISAKATFNMKDAKVATFQITTPFYDEVRAEAEMNGEWNDFTNRAQFNLGTKEVTWTSKFSMMNGISAEASVVSPWKSFDVVAAHTGDLNAWTNSASLTLDRKLVGKVYSEWRQGTTSSIKVGTMNMPFEQLTNFEFYSDFKNTNVKTRALSKLTWNTGKTIEAQAMFTTTNGYRVTASMSSPFTENYSTEATFTGDQTNFELNADAQWATDQKIVFTTSLDSRTGVDAKIAVDSPWKKASFTVNKHGTPTEFLVNANALSDDVSIATVELTYSKGASTKTTWKLVTPYELVKEFSGSFDHNGDLQTFRNKLNVKHNDQTASLDTTFDMKSRYYLKVICLNPYQNFETENSFTGNMEDMTLESSMTIGSEKSEVNFEFSQRSAIVTKLGFKTPFHEPIKAELSFSMTTNSVMVSYGSKRVTANFDLNMVNGYEATGRFTTPFEGYESGQMTVRHSGDLTNFEQLVELRFLSDVARYESGFSTFGRYRGNVKVQSPWYNGDAEFEHNGDLENFSNSMTANYVTGKTITAESKWKWTATEIECSANLRSPFKNIDVSYSHSLSTRMDLTANAELSWEPTKKIEASVTYRMQPTIRASFDVKTPWTDMSGAYNHQGTYATRCNADVVLNVAQKRMAAQWTINQLNGLTTTINVETPWKNFQGELSHEGPWDNFDSTISATYETGKTIKLETTFKLEPEFVFTSKLTSPMKSGRVLYRHSGSWTQRFTCNLETERDNQEFISGELEWNTFTGYQSTFKVVNPWKNVEGGFKTNADLNNLESSADFTLADQKFEGMFNYQTANGKSASFKTITPWRTVEANVAVTGELKSIISEAMFSWETGKKVETRVSWSIEENAKSASWDVETPWRNMNANARLTTVAQTYTGTSSVSWETGKTISANGRFTLTPTTLNTELTIQTPWRTISMDCDHDGDLTAFRNFANFSWEAGKTISAESTFNTVNGYTGSFKTATPWRTVEGEVRHTGELDNLDSMAKFSWETGKEMKVDIRRTKTGAMSTSTVTVNSPWRVMSAEYTRTGDLTNFSTDAEVSWEAGKKATMTTKFDMTNGIVFETNVQCLTYRVGSKFNYNGGPKAFTSHAEGTYNNQTISADVEFDIKTRTYGKITVNTPWRNVYAEVNHQGPPTSMTNTMEVSWEQGKVVKTTTTFNSNPAKLNFKLESPWKNCESEVALTGDVETNFSASAKYDCENQSVFSAELSLDRRNPIIFTAKVTGMETSVETGFLFNGNMNAFQTSGNWKWNEKEIEGEAEWNMEPLNGKAKLIIPGRTMETTFSFTTTDKMAAKATVSWETGKEISFEGEFDMRNGYKGEANIETPWKTVSAEFTHKGDYNKFENSAEFSWGPSKKVDATVVFSTTNGYKLDASMNTPFQMIGNMVVALEHTGELTGDFSTTASAQWMNNKRMDFTAMRAAAMIKMTFHCPVCEPISVELTSLSDMYNWTATAKYGTETITLEPTFVNNPNRIAATLAITTPFTDFEQLNLEFVHTGAQSLQASDLTFSNKVKVVGYKQTSVVLETAFDGAEVTQSLKTNIPAIGNVDWLVKKSGKEYTISIGQNNKRIEGTATYKYNKRQFKTVASGTVTLTTPFQGYEDNKVDASLEFSGRLFKLILDGHKGAMSNTKNLQVYGMLTTKNGGNQLDSYIKTTYDTEGEQQLTFNYDLSDTRLTAAFANNIKVCDWCTIDTRLTINHSRTDAGLVHTGEFNYTYKGVQGRTQWNAGSNHYMCETGFTYSRDGTSLITYSHKTTWTSGYTKLDHEMAMSCSKNMEFKMSYDWTMSKKTWSLTMSADPTNVYTVTGEYEIAQDWTMMVEFTTPHDMARTGKLEWTVAPQRPWSVSIKSNLNNQSVEFTGSLNYAGIENIEGQVTFKATSVPTMKVTFKNAKVGTQWKPNMTVQWAEDKRMELSGTFDWSSTYRAAIELSTPFDALRSLTTDITVTDQLPNTLSASVEFQTNKMASKITSQLDIDIARKTLTLTVASPFEVLESAEVRLAMSPRLLASVKANNKVLFNLNGNMNWTSYLKHAYTVEVTYPFWNEYMKLSVDNDLTNLSAISVDMEMDYMRGKQLAVRGTYRTDTTNTMNVEVNTPFEKFETVKYTLAWSGKPTKWSETTELEMYYGKISTSTSFELADTVFTFHQATTGAMKNGVNDFNFSKDIRFNGDQTAFTLEAEIDGSFVPTMKTKTTWSAANIVFGFEGSYENYHVEYNQRGEADDFNVNWSYSEPESTVFSTSTVERLNGELAIKLTDKVQLTLKVKVDEDELEKSLTVDWMKADYTSQLKRSDVVVMDYSAKYERTAAPFMFTGETELLIESWNFNAGSKLTVAEDQFSFVINDINENKDVWAMKAINRINADNEYTPEITITAFDETYEFDGLYKNEGSGLVRDFKFEMRGPKSQDKQINFKFAFVTQSVQLVPGEMKLFLSGTSDNKETTLVDMDAMWGNDHAIITFRDPQPMKYSMEFSVTTRGQIVEVVANWDTTKTDAHWTFNMENRLQSSSQRLTHYLDMHVDYLGVSRGFTHNLDWRQRTFEHKLTADYNGQQAGYDYTYTQGDQISLIGEVITPWRNVKATWTSETSKYDATFTVMWDSARDQTKKFVGRSTLDNIGMNSYKWTTTITHPALNNDLVLTDYISYDTERIYLAYKKIVSYSRDTTKDVTVNFSLEKSYKWGIEVTQPFNNVDFKFGTEFMTTSGKAFFTYMGTDGLKNKFELTSGMLADVFHLEFVSPLKSFKVEMSQTGNTRTIIATIDGKSYKMTMTSNKPEYYMEVKAYYSPADATKFYKFEAAKIEGGYQVKLVNQEGSTTTTEGLASVSVSDNKTVSGKLYWNPNLVAQTKAKIAELKSELKTLVRTLSVASKQEATAKMNSLRLGNDFANIMPHHETEMSRLLADIARFQSDMQAAYNDDVMGIKTFDRTTNYHIERMMEGFEKMRVDVERYYNETIAPTIEMIGESMDNITTQLNAKFNEVQAQIEGMFGTMTEKWIAEVDVIAAKLETVVEWLQQYTDKVVAYAGQYVNIDGLKGIHTQTIGLFTKYSDAAYNTVKGVTSPTLFTDAIYAMHDTISTWLSEMGYTNFLVTINDAMSDRARYLVQYYDVAGNAKMLLDATRRIALEHLNSWLTKYVDQTLNEIKWTAFDVENGRIEFEMTLPTDFEGIKYAQFTSDLKQRFDSVLAHYNKYHFNYAEMFYMYKPQSVDQILPPFNAYGMVAGQHIRTFDGRHYDFQADSCSYLLARDFVDGNFTVFYHYDTKTVTAHSNGVVIDMKNDATIMVDGQATELPYMFVNTTVVKMGHQVIFTNRLGVKVTFDTEHDLVLVEMSGYYFGKTGGLLGTYNYEPSDDWMSSRNVNETRLQPFVQSWTTQCSAFKSQQSFLEVKNSKEHRACSVLRDSSAFSTCRSVVDVKNAFHKCVQDMSNAVGMDEMEGPCQAVKFYQTECRMAGVTVEELSQCVTCATGRTMNEVKTVSTQNMADIVVVFEEKECNTNSKRKLSQLSGMVADSLLKKGFRDVRFGVVGFGGFGVHNEPHIHTSVGQTFFSAANMAKAAGELVVDGGDKTDVFGAVQFAAQYPFRAGANRMIMLMPCSDCSETTLSYRAMATQLANEDITLHAMLEHDFVQYGKQPASNRLYGMDNGKIYSAQDLGNLRGNPSIFTSVSKPKDQCSSLALQTHGSVFNLNKLKETSSTAKKMMTIFADRFAQQAQPTECQSCRCQYNALFGEARSVCSKC